MTIEERLNNIELNQTLLDQRLSDLELKDLDAQISEASQAIQLKPPQEANPTELLRDAEAVEILVYFSQSSYCNRWYK